MIERKWVKEVGKSTKVYSRDRIKKHYAELIINLLNKND